MSDDVKHAIVCEMKRIAGELGHAPQRREWDQYSEISRYQIEKLFGLYSAAVVASGFIPNEPNKPKVKAEDLFGRDVKEVLSAHQLSAPQKLIVPAAKVRSIVAIPDCHYPWVSKPALERLYEFVAKHKPDVIVQLGDLYDMLAHSKYPRSRNIYNPHEEITLGFEMAGDMWKTLRTISPRSECFQILGNHDVRPLKRILETYPDGEVFFSIEKYFKFEGVTTQMDARIPLDLGLCSAFHGVFTRPGMHMRHLKKSVIRAHDHNAWIVYERFGDEVLFEMSCALMADPHSKVMAYSPMKVYNEKPGFAFVDEYGPRIILA